MFMIHDGMERNDGRRNKRRRLDLPPSHQLGGLGDRLPVDRMTSQLNYEEIEEDGDYISAVESTIPADLRGIPPGNADFENVEGNMEMNSMVDEVFSLSQAIGENACNKILSVFSNHSGKVEQFITKYKKVENLRECLKRRTKNRLIRKGFKAENRLSEKGIGYEVYWRNPIDALRCQVRNVRRDELYTKSPDRVSIRSHPINS